MDKIESESQVVATHKIHSRNLLKVWNTFTLTTKKMPGNQARGGRYTRGKEL